jgi:myosin-5
LENKVIELTQNLTKKTQDNKSLLNQLSILENQVASWQEKHSTLETRSMNLEKDAIKANDAIAKTLRLESELKTLQSRYEETLANLNKMEKEGAALKDTLTKRSAELEIALTAQGSADQVRGSLNQEIQTLKLEVERLSQNGPPLSPMSNGQKTPVNGRLNGLLSVSTGKRSNRTPRRRSYIDGGADSSFTDDLRIGSVAYNPRPASMAFSPAALQKNWPANGVDVAVPVTDNIDSEVRIHAYMLICRSKDFWKRTSY